MSRWMAFHCCNLPLSSDPDLHHVPYHGTGLLLEADNEMGQRGSGPHKKLVPGRGWEWVPSGLTLLPARHGVCCPHEGPTKGGRRDPVAARSPGRSMLGPCSVVLGPLSLADTGQG